MNKLLYATLLASCAAPVQAQTVQAQVAPDVWTALQLCHSDNLYHFKTGACPTPGLVPSPSLGGLPAGPTPFNISDALIPGQPIPPSAKPDVVGAFRFIMHDAGVNSDDAVVGLCGTSHLHQYYGRKGWDCTKTYESMRASVGSPGNDFNGQLAVNGSGYWMPAMLDGQGNVVKPAFVSGYYKRRPASDPKCGGLGTVFGAVGKCVGVPNGIRMIGGYNVVKGVLDDPQSQWFNCQGPTARPGHYANLTIALANCPVGQGNLVGAVIEMYDCWDGKNLDTPDHRAHMAHQRYDPNSGQPSCDAAHPYVIPQLTLGAWFPATAGAHFSSDMDKTPGTTFHADYFENWDPTVKAMWTDHCINLMLNCSAGDLGNGYKIKGAAI